MSDSKRWQGQQGNIIGKENEKRFYEAIALRKDLPDWFESILKPNDDSELDKNGVDFLVVIRHKPRVLFVQIKSSKRGVRNFKRTNKELGRYFSRPIFVFIIKEGYYLEEIKDMFVEAIETAMKSGFPREIFYI